MHTSLIICSRNRAEQLRLALAHLLTLDPLPPRFELILIDSASTDETVAVMRGFAASSPWPVTIRTADRQGLGHARNCGIRAAQGELLVFTDDDCYLAPDYFTHLLAAMGGAAHDFGGGDVRLFDPADAPVSIAHYGLTRIIPPHSVLPPGLILGANFFFLRHVFMAAGLFRDDLGSGTPYPCEDAEMVARASRLGFSGVLLPEAICHHHHRRRPGTTEMDRLIREYDAGAGAYYALMLAAGERSIWDLWAARSLPTGDLSLWPARSLERLQREMQSAANLLADLLEARHSHDAPTFAATPADCRLPC